MVEILRVAPTLPESFILDLSGKCKATLRTSSANDSSALVLLRENSKSKCNRVNRVASDVCRVKEIQSLRDDGDGIARIAL